MLRMPEDGSGFSTGISALVHAVGGTCRPHGAWFHSPWQKGTVPGGCHGRRLCTCEMGRQCGVWSVVEPG
jgi:hypothetical protein